MKTSKFFFGAMLAVACATVFVGCETGTSKKNKTTDQFDNNTNKNGEETVTPGDRDGSEAKPYNVQDLLDMKNNGTLPAKNEGKTKSWVVGYIVGCYNYNNGNDAKWIIGADTATTNVLIADAADCTDTYAVAAVKLGAFKSVLNLSANPGNLGKKLTLYGIVEKYCSVAGVVNLEKVLLDGTAVELPGGDPNATLSATFFNGLDNFTIKDVTMPDSASYIWKHDSEYHVVKASAYVSGKNYAAESWLISPAIDLSKLTSATLTFDHAAKFQNGKVADEFQVMVAENPSEKLNATEWNKLTIPTMPKSGTWNAVSSGTIDLSAYAGKTNVRIAFRYVSTAKAADTWQIKNVVVK